MLSVLLAYPELNFHEHKEDQDPLFHLVLRTPPSKFYSTSKTDVIQLLLKHGADPFSTDRLGETALHILATLSTEEDIQLLRVILAASSGPIYCVNDRNLYGDTPLIIAVICDNKLAIKMFLELGASPNIRGEYDATALDYALRQKDSELIAILNAVGAETGDDMDYGTL